MPESEIRVRTRLLRKGIILAAIGSGLIAGMAVLASSQANPSADVRYAENFPREGMETVYGLPLAWENAQVFAAWHDEIKLTTQETADLEAATVSLASPCCDDNPLARCCCERGGLICNIVRTTRGLGAYLVRAGYSFGEVTAAMEQWMRFIHGDYYVARALVDQGQDPLSHGLFRPSNGACYRGLCGAPLREGGCGGMGPEVIVDRPTT